MREICGLESSLEDCNGVILSCDIAQILGSTVMESVVDHLEFGRLLAISQPMAGVWELRLWVGF